MLGKSTRKSLLEHKWLATLKKDSNMYQTKTRIKRSCVLGINDLTLIANEVHDEFQDQIFTENRIYQLFSSLLKIKRKSGITTTMGVSKYPETNTGEIDSRRANIAPMMVEVGAEYFTTNFNQIFNELPSLYRPSIRQLEESVKICNDISKKVELDEISEKAKKDKLTYLFKWNEIGGKKFERFLAGETELPYEVSKVRSPSKSTFLCDFGLPNYDYGLRVKIGIAAKKDAASIVLTNQSNGKECMKINLIVKEVHGNLYLYR